MAAKGEIETEGRVFDDILEKLEDNKYVQEIKYHLDQLSVGRKECHEDEQTERFLSWARIERNLKIVTVDIPRGILPESYDGQLHDVKVFVKHGPDDSVYDNNKNIRDRIARGNCFLHLGGKSPRTYCVLQAMKKFTGGLGDDDDRETGDMMIWQKYFTKPLEETDVIIATSKANGEAAHLSCIQIDGQFILCGGSKNVHLLFRNKADIEKYVEPRYRIATEICHSVVQFLDAMTPQDKERLLSFLVASRYTAVFEILSPSHQHVVNLSYLKSPALKFITWTKCELEPSEKLQHLNVIPPHVGIELAKCLGLDPITYEVLKMSELDQYMKKIRQGFNLEGEVLYFLDSDSHVIGLLKKKTTWYIMCRAIREKVKTAVRQVLKNPDTYSKTKTLNNIEKRVKEIRRWLNLDETTTQEWTTIGQDCLTWVLHELEAGKITPEEVADMFPVYWERFLADTGSSDKINVTEEKTEGACGS